MAAYKKGYPLRLVALFRTPPCFVRGRLTLLQWLEQPFSATGDNVPAACFNSVPAEADQTTTFQLAPAWLMRVISNKALKTFCAIHHAADAPMQAWRNIVEASTFPNFAALKQAFNAVDKVGDYVVFDIGGNKYRIITAIHFSNQQLFIRHVFTHKEYDRWKP